MLFKDQDIFSGSLLIGCALIGYFFAAQLENMVVAGLSAAFYPSLLFTVMLLCGASLIYQGVKRQDKIPLPACKWRQLLPMVAALAIYATLLEYIGFIASTVLFMIAAMYIFGEKRKKFLLTVPFITAVVIYYLFSLAFMIRLP